MKAQSAIEFLTTYSFMFILIAIALLIIIVISVSTRTYIPTACVGTSGLNCEFASYTSNGTQKISNVIVILTNAQSTPLNVISVQVTINSQQATGLCSKTFPIIGNTFVYSGNSITCSATYSGVIKQLGTSITGAYSVNAYFCNSPISQLNPSNCSYDNVIYTGEFTTQVAPG